MADVRVFDASRPASKNRASKSSIMLSSLIASNGLSAFLSWQHRSLQA
jgi:hypothetical protein